MRSGRPQALIHGSHALPVDVEDFEDYPTRRRDGIGDQGFGVKWIGVVLRQRKRGRLRCPSLLFDRCGPHDAGAGGAGENKGRGVLRVGHEEQGLSQ